MGRPLLSFASFDAYWPRVGGKKHCFTILMNNGVDREKESGEGYRVATKSISLLPYLLYSD